MNVIVLFLALGLFGPALQECANGCLMCGAASACQLCDQPGMYYLQSNSCTKAALTNCQVLASDGTCAQCAKDYFFDATARACVAIGSAQITGCLFYDNTKKCAVCASTHYLTSTGICTILTGTVSQCKTYSEDKVCAGCNDGYMFDLARKSCVQKPNTPNCLEFSYLYCTACGSDYFLNPNLHLSSKYSASAVQASFLAKVQADLRGSTLWGYTEVCENKNLSINCDQHLTASSCKTCAENYFMSDGVCVKNPSSSISNCLWFTKEGACVKCQLGFFFENQSSCKPIVPVQGCSAYDQQASSTTCTACETGLYLAQGQCLARLFPTIANCQTLSPKAEGCQSCATKFRPTDDGLACLPETDNCQAYSPSGQSSLAHYCVQCKDGYYLSQTGGAIVCAQGQVANCQRYFLNSGTCVLCSEGFYLLQGKCETHTKTTNCAVHDPNNPNVCLQCQAGYYPFMIKDECKQLTITPITGCAQYSPDWKYCQRCQDYSVSQQKNYYLNYQGECKEILTSNCEAMNRFGECTKCKPDFLLLPNRTCMDFKDTSFNCEKVNFQGQSLIADQGLRTCSSCKNDPSPFFPLTFKGQAICGDDKLMAAFGGTMITNCVRYSNSFPPKCLECKWLDNDKFYLDPNAQGENPVFCKSSCPGNSYAVIDNLDGTRRACIALNSADDEFKMQIKKCKLLARVSQFKTGEEAYKGYRCLEFDTGVDYKIFYNFKLNTPIDVFIGYELGKDLINIPNYYGFVAYPFVLSDTPEAPLKSKATDFVAVNSCNLYYMDIKIDVVKFCLRCDFGKQLKITKQVDGSYLTTCETTWNDCDSTVQYGGLPSYLNAMLSCHKCSVDTKVLKLHISLTNEDVKEYNTNNSNSNYKIPFQNYLQPNSGYQNGIECNEPPSDGNSDKVNNCLVYGSINVMGAGGTDTFLKCLACKPDFKAIPANFQYSDGGTVQFTLNEAIINSCSSISGCLESNPNAKVSNGCTQCQDNQAFEDQKQQSCSAVTSITNCFIREDGSNCSICKTGYYLKTVDGSKSCLPYTTSPLACTAYQFVDESAFSIAKNSEDSSDTNSNLRVQKYYNWRGKYQAPGCQSCLSTGFRIAVPTNGITQCVQADNSKHPDIDGSDQKVDGCKFYSTTKASDGKLLCSECNSPMKLSSSLHKCRTINNEAKRNNCLFFFENETEKCSKCVEGKANVEGECKEKSAGCSLADNSYQPFELCLTCQEGHSLSIKREHCVPGAVTNCAAYQQGSITVCTKCKNGYALVLLGTGSYFCFPLDASLNCNQVQEGRDLGFESGVLSCRECANDVSNSKFFVLTPFVATHTQAKTVCLKFRASDTDNCAAYDQASSPISRNTFVCTACKPDYYPGTQNTCAAITKVNECVAYSTTTGLCTQCPEGKWYDQGEKKCVAFLTNIGTDIADCKVYASATQCSQCKAEKQLKDNKCVTPQTIIPDCLSYSSGGYCVECKGGFFLVSPTLCQIVVAKDCASVLNPNTCSSCPTGKGFKKEGDITSCVNMSITNCAVYNGVFPFVCKFCNTDYYLSSGTCTAVETASKVANCKYMATATTCAQCEHKYLLNVDKTKCTDTGITTGTNCKNFPTDGTAACVQCQNGFYFVNDVCVPCLTNANDGCAGCTPGANKCLVCKTGYFMNADGACALNK